MAVEVTKKQAEQVLSQVKKKYRWAITLQEGRIYVSSDNKFMIKNVGPRCWGIYINDGSTDWDIDWVGSTYPTLKSAQDSRMVQNA